MGLFDFQIAEVAVRAGLVGVSPMPGRNGAYASDINSILRWGADIVVTLTSTEELQVQGASSMGEDLAAAGVMWRHLPIKDFGALDGDSTGWGKTAEACSAKLDKGGRVLVHCSAGCGRSGMVALRLMVEAGEDAVTALERLRAERPCAVQTDNQFEWAALPMRARD